MWQGERTGYLLRGCDVFGRSSLQSPAEDEGIVLEFQLKNNKLRLEPTYTVVILKQHGH